MSTDRALANEIAVVVAERVSRNSRFQHHACHPRIPDRCSSFPNNWFLAKGIGSLPLQADGTALPENREKCPLSR